MQSLLLDFETRKQEPRAHFFKVFFLVYREMNLFYFKAMALNSRITSQIYHKLRQYIKAINRKRNLHRPGQNNPKVTSNCQLREGTQEIDLLRKGGAQKSYSKCTPDKTI